MTGNAQSSLFSSAPVLVIAGPTASGKSAAALAVAEQFDGTVINADSMQIYRELRVLTARPSPEDEARVPHRLYGALPAAERCNAARWRDLAVVEIAAAQAQNRLPILCGGTGLYLKALMEGLSPVPEVPESVRADIRKRLAREGPEALHAELAARSDEMAERLAPADRQRVARALEVLEATGKSLADWQALSVEGAPERLRFTVILFDPPRDDLYEACDRRFEAMLDAGALQEVKDLLALELDPALPAMKALGVQELAAYLAGEMSREDALGAGQQATRRYAKRQTTWFGNQIVPELRITKQYSKRLNEKIFSFIMKKRLTESR